MKKSEYLYSVLLSLAILVITVFMVKSAYTSVSHPELTQMQVMYTVLGIEY